MLWGIEILLRSFMMDICKNLFVILRNIQCVGWVLSNMYLILALFMG